ncbi:MAG: Multicopper oxidase [uncultured Propionibacteriaceae bacterium]|uniref:Multicopper oxidase n=1 Tax=uncultured Propionibacteriaceae bacterium TaxID=257457 RepID=A0A6J4MZF5_9ACTN|nr:MAG: Multicopper oxidase [uncultured Propionibacteriaceae bacterium]
MTTVALLGLDLILGLLALALWAYAAVRAGASGLPWALAGLLVLLARLVTVLVLAGRGWELAAERVTVGVPLGLLAAAAAIGLLVRARRRGPTGSTAARMALWSAAAASAVSLLLTGVVGYPGGPGAAAHDHSHPGRVSVADLRTAAVGPAKKFKLTAQTQAVTLPSGRVVDAWTFGSLPGPTLTAQVGQTLEITLRNRDITTGVTLHWHGLSVPNGEDGVAGVTQDAVFPGETFVYRFRAEQPGTFWYHTHQHAREAIARGLYGALVVQPATRSTAGVDLVLPFHTIGKIPILGDSDQVQRDVVAAGTPVRLRLVNTEQQPRRFALNGAAFRVVALDGVDLNGPTEVSDQAIRVPAGGRYDLAFTMPANPVRLSVEGARQAGLVLAGSADAPEPEAKVAKATFDPTRYGSPQPVPDMTGKFDVSSTIVLDRLPRVVNGRPALAQTVNGGVYPDITPIMVAEGDLVRIRVVNRSFETHPMHPHGHHILVLSVNGRAPTGSPLLLDTFDVQPGEVWEVALRADNPGIWMNHCHNLEHATSGMMFHLAYAGVSTPFTHGPGSPNVPE